MKQAFKSHARNEWGWLTGKPMLFLLIGFLLFEGVIAQTWDRYVDADPWVSANLEIIPQSEGLPVIAYRINARRIVSGDWTATTRDAAGERIETSKGKGNYSPTRNGGAWPWDAFFEPPVPAVPDQPYRVCVFYSLTSGSGVQQETPEYCSDLEVPR